MEMLALWKKKLFDFFSGPHSAFADIQSQSQHGRTTNNIGGNRRAKLNFPNRISGSSLPVSC
ncbi:MAG: hypothetical protein CMJ77_01865 [Planctomycetaceae bacterium]|nr:hypothetical protein [Planctomycetaceae bacterium]